MFANHFLIPAISNSHCHNDNLILVCQNDQNGSVGVVVNQPIKTTFKSIWSSLDIHAKPTPFDDDYLHYGGPINTQSGFVLHRSAANWKSSIKIVADLQLTFSKDVMLSLASGAASTDMKVMMGYAGWAAGDLEAEIKTDKWIVCPADIETLFELTAAEQLPHLYTKLGVSGKSFIHSMGHA